ncbi:DUF3100 domain-containing protein [Virgibacillus halophilus]|uniref:DUF3100 domain-containing protein n=1 Tax=Tigheibacillus halophilus TaxID=361280 RepID=A0ABU5C5N2_9BACI|nr:DUF3100 domain-containing protein [Virgibacillus halophilus]
MLVTIAPFMAKVGVLAGANLPKLIDVGPALAFQELGHIGTMMIALPIALMLGIKREAIGATSSTCRDKDYGLICHLYGADSPEARGALSIYIIGFFYRHNVHWIFGQFCGISRYFPSFGTRHGLWNRQRGNDGSCVQHPRSDLSA